MNYRWIITKDNVSDGEDVGVEGPQNVDSSLRENRSHFSLYDEDGNLYYQGYIYGDYEGFEPLDDFGMPNAGCTGIKIDGQWL